MEFHHRSVLFEESVDALQPSDGKILVDGTAGGGGHSAALAQRLGNGRLISIDQDPDAVSVLHQRLDPLGNVTIVQDNFANLNLILTSLHIDSIDGMLLDLGVSSHQLDTGERGFSFHQDAPLDMRMSQQGISAADIVNTYSQSDLANVIWRYGEEKYARSIARNLVKEREKGPIATTFQLVTVIKASMPAAAMRDGHPARRTFQALRIEVNGELDKLNQTLDDAFEALKPGGRLAVITFHSLEDRMVKQRYAGWCTGCTCPKEFPVCICGKTPRGKLPFKAKPPSKEELVNNPRARSSRLRVIEKIK